ncbi:MAG: RlmE family RNA methyltransferase [Nitrososphaeria archaeon]
MKPEEAKRDHYRRMARRAGYVSRAAFKILEMHRKYGIFKKGQRVLDLGASPGGWSQVASKLIGDEGEVYAVDLRPIKFEADNVKYLRMNVLNEEPHISGFDVVISDLAPNVSGVWEHDQYMQITLATRALEIAEKVLNRGGTFVCKLFDGEGVNDIVRRVRNEFSFVKLTKPKASRKESSELYLICKNYLKGPE